MVVEGVRRAEVWNRMRSFIHPTSFYDATDEPIAGLDWEDERMAREVLAHVDGSNNVGDLVSRVPFSQYKIYRAIAEMLEHRVIRPADVTGVVDREKRLQRKLVEAETAAQAGRWTESMEMLQGLASANPGRADILKALLAVTDGFRRAIYEHNFTLDDTPVVMIGPSTLETLAMNPTEAFLLSRIDGRLTVRAILKISPVPEFDGLRTFKRLLAARVIDFPHRNSGAA